jgi:hypothetical protein
MLCAYCSMFTDLLDDMTCETLEGNAVGGGDCAK